jgi:RHS repeat-associated protein
VTCYDNAAVGSGTIVNQVQLVYNSFAQLIADYQSHSGAVVVGTTPVCQYGYADGSTNTVRQTSMTYPNGRVLSYSYGATGSNEDAASRIASLIDNDGVTHLADYAYLGRGDIIQQVSPQPGLMYTLIGIDGGNDPVTGDIYRGLDSFSRVKDLIWLGTGAGGSSSSSSGPANILERVQHGYDRVDNRLYRAEPVDPSDQHDEFYDYDAIYRLKDFQRGSLNTTKTGIAALKFAQCWNLDETGNWTGFREDDNGDGHWDLMQNRASNPANEITLVTESAGPSSVTPEYSAAGNMSVIPQPNAPTLSYTATYDAWHRLVQLAAAGVTVAEYFYDALNRRVIKISYSGGVATETRHFYYSTNWQVLEERLGSSATVDRQFVWGVRYVDDLVLRDRDTNSGGMLNERLYPLQDSNWNVTALCDRLGNIQERYCFAAYCTPVFLTPGYGPKSASSFSWETLFAGYRWDGEAALYHVRARNLHSQLGVWIQRDTPGFTSETNLYRYVLGNPVNATDPSGRFPVLIVLALLAAAAAFSAGYTVTYVSTGGNVRASLAVGGGAAVVAFVTVITAGTGGSLFATLSISGGGNAALLAGTSVAISIPPAIAATNVIVVGAAVCVVLAATTRAGGGRGGSRGRGRRDSDTRIACSVLYGWCVPVDWPNQCGDCLNICRNYRRWPFWKCPLTGRNRSQSAPEDFTPPIQEPW